MQLSPIIILGSRSGEGWVGLKKSLLDLTVVWLVFMLGTLGTLKWISSHGDLVFRAGIFLTVSFGILHVPMMIFLFKKKTPAKISKRPCFTNRIQLKDEAGSTPPNVLKSAIVYFSLFLPSMSD